ncbi:MAG: Tm-1-like ATP-binding domain-containing protein [Firmicutes bacterium]|nr:Tm-1-like ATP-binding domain-containing protein [Bacillota bacterium]
MPTVVVLGTLDTKGRELAYVRDVIREQGLDTLLVDAGVTDPAVEPDIPRQEVGRAAGVDPDELARRRDRGAAVAAMARAAAATVRRLYDEGRLDAILCLGGSAGSSIGAAAMQQLPVGVPKLLVSTMASGDTRPYVGVKDVTLMYSVIDISGLNRFSRLVLGNAARAVAGMAAGRAAAGESGRAGEKPLIAATMFGVTTPCVTAAREYLESRGYEVLVFHATGSGGRAMEGLVDDGLVGAVLDVTTTEWADELVGGVLNAGPQRLEAAGRKGIPQVVSVGALDMVNFGPPETVPEKFRGRRFYPHNPTVTLMRTTPEECAELGRILAEKLNRATGPTKVFLPLRGLSMIDADGQPFWDPEADRALFDALRRHLRPEIERVELDLHINDPEFALAMARALESMLTPSPAG